MACIKNIVLQHFSKQIAAFLLSDTSKLLVWNNKKDSFRLKQYLFRVLMCVRSYQKNTSCSSWIVWSVIICEFCETFTSGFNRIIIFKIKDYEEGILEEYKTL